MSSPDRPLTTVPQRLEYLQRLKRHQVVEGGIRDVGDVVVVEEEILQGGEVSERCLLDGHHLIVTQLAATDSHWSTHWTMLFFSTTLDFCSIIYGLNDGNPGF